MAASKFITLNFNKTKFIQFSSKHLETIKEHIKYGDKYLMNTNNANFLGLIMDNSLSWRLHTDQAQN